MKIATYVHIRLKGTKNTRVYTYKYLFSDESLIIRLQKNVVVEGKTGEI